MTNDEFLQLIKQSFKTYLEVGTSRSNKKLKILHGNIAKDLQSKLDEKFCINSLGYGDNKEALINGRYYPKNADITISKNNKNVAGYSVKFIMRNYSQNSNNYFENMLGETANIRTNDIPYFQIFIIFEKVPYFKKNGKFIKYDMISEHNLDKYLALSQDNPNVFFHTPDITLVAILKLKEKEPDYKFSDSEDYADYYKSVINDNDLIQYSQKIKDDFGNNVILNNYESFIDRTYHLIMGKIK